MMQSSKRSAAYEALPLSVSKVPQSSEHDVPRREMTERPQEQRNPIKAWRWETFTFLLGTAALAAILGMLLSFKNKSARDVSLRTRAGEIQVTAIIAALAQVAQSALLVPISYCIGQLKWKWFQNRNRTVDLDRFDLASRGPDGCVRLLWHFSWRQRLVSIGALSTILMLLFPTFVQQSVQEGDMDIVVFNSSVASMARAKNVADSTRGNVKLYTLTGNGTASSYEVNTALNNALRSGFALRNPIDYYNRWEVSGDSAPGLAGCSLRTGAKCSWDAFKTLALCSSAEYVTRDIILDDGHISLPALQDIQNQGSFQDTPFFRSGLRGYTGKNESGGTTFPPTSLSDGTNLPNLAEVYYLYYDTDLDPNVLDMSNITHWNALKGTFQFCIQTLNATQGSTSNSRDVTMTLMNSTTNIHWNQSTRDNSSAFCTKVDGEQEDFCVSERFMQRLAFHLNLIFNATAFSNGPGLKDIRYSSEWGPLLVNPIYIIDHTHFERIWLFQDMLEGIAFSLTNKFRSDASTSEEVYGTYTRPVNAVLVDFRWLILPSALWIMIAIFFVSTVITTRYTPVWKSSPLPLLSIIGSDDTPASGDKIRKEAKKTWVGLRRTQHGWQMLDTMEENNGDKVEESKDGSVAEDFHAD